MGVGARRVCQTRARHGRTGEVPVLGRPGRKGREAPAWAVCRVLRARRTCGVGATAIRAILGISGLSHNMTRRILGEHGMAGSAGRRARRVPWAGHGRECSNPVWRTDRALLPGGRWPVAHGDGAPRLIIGYGIFGRAAPANAAGVPRKAIAEHGKPAPVTAGHGAQSCANGPEPGRRGATAFERFLVASGTRHVLSGVGHPQANGKIERFFGEVKARPGTFADAGGTVAWWNTAKPHRSPDFKAGETPCEALGARMPPEGEGAVMGGAAGEAYRVHRGRPRLPEGAS